MDQETPSAETTDSEADALTPGEVTPSGDGVLDERVTPAEESDHVPTTLRQVVGALIFAAPHALSLKEIRNCLVEVAKTHGGVFARHAAITDQEILTAIEETMVELDRVCGGILLSETANGFRFQSDAAVGTWVRHLLGAGRATRLSRPSLETLAIIAYRQPVTRSEIESVRGVSVDHVIKLLMEMQLVRISGRSELPGKPFQYGTTQSFLEHFGLTNIDDLAKVDPALFAARAEAAQAAAETSAAAAPAVTETLVSEPATEAAIAESAPVEHPSNDA